MLLLIFLALPMANRVMGQTVFQSPSSLIKYLTYQSARPDKYMLQAGLFSCGAANGETHDNRALTVQLVNMGSSAIPSIEEVLDALESQGEKRPRVANSEWLLLAYAQIKGKEAYPRLRSMQGNPRLASLAIGIDNAVAHALGLTSYVSLLRRTDPMGMHRCAVNNSADLTLSPTPCVAPSREEALPHFRCDRREEPQHALDQLILAWEEGDREALEASLGPLAKGAFDQLLKTRPWETMRAEFGPDRSGRIVGMGYRFAVPGHWSKPGLTLDVDRGPWSVEAQAANPELETLFKNGSGDDCGKFRLRFSRKTPGKGFGQRYFVDNANLADLLRLATSCATASGAAR